MRDRPNDQHRAIASRKMRRPLRKDEDVSHNDDDKSNNSPANLTVMKHGAHSHHTATTGSLRKLRKALTMHHRKEKLYGLLLCAALLLGSACRTRFVIYTPEQCVDIDRQGHVHPINTYAPVVRRVCHD